LSNFIGTRRESKTDIIVIGGGIAGASIAAHLAAHAQVRLLEMEAQPGYHSTGRSAAVFATTYGNSTVRALTVASRPFFFAPPAGFCSTALVKPRLVLILANPTQREALENFGPTAFPDDRIEYLTSAQALQYCPILRVDDLSGALLYRGPADIEVHELHQGYLRLLKSRGGEFKANTEVIGLERANGEWCVNTPGEVLRASIVVNAAGAWAGDLGKMAGACDIGLEPRRRTALLIDPPAGLATESWPLLADVGDRFYLKPDAGLLLLSPCDETLTPACDAQPDEMDVAVAVDRLEQATTLEVRHIRRKWAGLRSFVRDRSPVVGYDPVRPGFFWLAALGGFGIQTAPALSALAAGLVLGREVGGALAHFDFEFEPSALAPARL
jgi:D-arginine dehydrogenase